VVNGNDSDESDNSDDDGKLSDYDLLNQYCTEELHIAGMLFSF
jgi:hypothetical protein